MKLPARLTVCVLVILIAATTAVSAQTSVTARTAPTPPEEQARAHYLLGANAYKAGDLNAAISEWEQVLKLKSTSEYTQKMLAKARSDRQSRLGNSEDAQAVSGTLKPSGLARIEDGDPFPVQVSPAIKKTPTSQSLVLSLDFANRVVAKQGDTVIVTGETRDYLVTGILFKVDNKVVAQKTGNGAYTFRWHVDNAFIGSHSLKVLEVRGTGTSEVKQGWVQVTETRPVIITSPLSGEELVAATQVQVALAKGFETAKVDVYTASGAVPAYANDKTFPKLQDTGFVWDVPALAKGQYTIQVRASTDDGTLLCAPPIVVRVPDRITLDNLPKSCYITVTDDSTMINFRASVHPKVNVSKVQFLCDGKPIAECVPPSLSVMWDARDLHGTHFFAARVTDADGHTYDSSSSKASVSNAPYDRLVEERTVHAPLVVLEFEAPQGQYRAAGDRGTENGAQWWIAQAKPLSQSKGSATSPTWAVISMSHLLGQPSLGLSGYWLVEIRYTNPTDQVLSGSVLGLWELHLDDYTSLCLQPFYFKDKASTSESLIPKELLRDVTVPARSYLDIAFEGIEMPSSSAARPAYVSMLPLTGKPIKLDIPSP